MGQAHRNAQRKLAACLGDTEDVDSEAEFQIMRESEQEVATARLMLNEMERELVDTLRAEQVANGVLEKQRRFIEKLVRDGVLADREAHHLLHEVQTNMASSRTVLAR